MRELTLEELEALRFGFGDAELERRYGWFDNRTINCNAVFHDLRLIWTLIPKAAVNSIGHAADLFRSERSIEWRSRRYVLEVVPSYYRIAFVRHPLRRLASCWKNKVRDKLHRTYHLFGVFEGMPFPDFVRIVADIDDSRADKHFRAASWDLTDGEGLAVDFLGKVENIERDWDLLTEVLRDAFDWTLKPIGHLNSTPGEVEYDEATRELAAKRYAADFDLFGYLP